jgi:surfactin synthase thioesterase subunit
MFYRWQRWCPPDVALVPLRLAGREDRAGEEPYISLAELADDAAEVITSLPPRPFVLVGHSMGAYVAWEVARRLERTGGPLPHRCLIAACGAPRPRDPARNIGHLPDEEFIDEVIRRYEGIPEGVRNEPQLMALVIPPLRADLRMIESYTCPLRTPIATSIGVLGGKEDPSVPAHRLEEWQDWTVGDFSAQWFEGGHFFLYPPARRGPSAEATMPLPFRAVLDCLPEVQGG